MANKAIGKRERIAWLDGFYGQECCGQAMQTGYDVIGLMCRHNDYAGIEENCYYAMCNVCSNIDTLCDQCVVDAIIDARR